MIQLDRYNNNAIRHCGMQGAKSENLQNLSTADQAMDIQADDVTGSRVHALIDGARHNVHAHS